MAKVMIVGKRPWKTTDAETGEEISGLSYVAILSSGKAIKFTSKEVYPVHEGEIEFSEKLAVEIPLITKIFNGGIKYQDGNSYGQSEEA